MILPHKLSQRLLTRTPYDTQVTLGNLGRIIVSSMVVEEISHRVLSELTKVMHLRSAVLLWSGEPPRILAHTGDVSQKTVIDSTAALLGKSQTPFIYRGAASSHQIKLLDEIQADLIIPLIVQHQTLGLLVLGPKTHRAGITHQDLQLLEIFGPELAIGLENAMSYNQILDFNRRLKDEVDKATDQLKTANEQVYKMNLQLHQLDQLKDEFISITSHELRTPLTAIRGYIWMAMHGKNKDEKFDLYMQRAYTSSERLIAMVNDTLDISRIESGRVELTPEPTNVVKLAEDVLAELNSKAAEKQQKLELVKTVGLPAAYCDPNKIHQVLTNLVGNALKFTPDKGKIKLYFEKDKQHITVSVQDNGPGISPEEQSKLFQKFSRLEKTASIQGTGLGLYLCKQIVELSKGQIWIDSQEGKGATFHFSLPISQDQPSIAPPQTKAFQRTPVTTT